jgi:hypothetical protein
MKATRSQWREPRRRGWSKLRYHRWAWCCSITDARDSNGDDVASTMKQIEPDVRILMFSGMSDVLQKASLYVDAFLPKGQSPTVVLDKIR